MDITSDPIPFSFPTAAAQAYGLRGQQPPTSAASEPAAQARGQRPRAVDQLVGGTVQSDVNRGVGFDGDAPAPASMAMYSRTAERLEAATRVALGQQLDVTG